MSSAQEHHAAARRYQAYYDEALRDVGMRAPQPILGQTVNDYRRETLRTLKKTFLQNHEFRKVNMRGLPADALQGFEPQVLKAAVKEANNPANVPKGELKQIVKYDERFNAVKFIDFIRQDHFVKLPNFGCQTPMMGGHRPGRRVLSFTTDKGRFDASGRALR
jgi:hypothetical protein